MSREKYNFKQALLDKGVSKNVAEDYLIVRKQVKAVNTETAFKMISKQIEKTNYTFESVLELCIFKSWRGFSSSWIDNLSTSEKDMLRVKEMSEYEKQKIKRQEILKAEKAQWAKS